MADTNFINGTVIEPAWLNDVNDAVYTTLPAVYTNLSNTANTALGDALVGVKRTETGTAATTLHLWIQKSKFRAADFGVVADGATNDHTAMTAAFAAIDANGGGELELPIGTILLNTSALTIPENLTLTGQAWEVSQIKAGGAWTCLTKSYGTHTDYNRLNLWARGVRFIGAATALGGVYIDRGDNCLFEKCGFTDFQATGAYGVYIKNTYWSHFVGCLFENIDTYGIQMAAEGGVGCNASTISGRCQFIGNNEVAFSGVFLNGQNLTVCMSDFSGTSNGLNGIVMENGEGIHIFDNYIERWQGQAIKATTGSLNRRIVVENNVLNSTGVPCLDFDHASVNDNIVVKNNRFPDMGGSQTCIDFGTSTNVNEFDNDEGTSNITTTYTVSQVSNASYRDTFTGTLTGVTGTVTGTFRYEKIGKNVTLYIPSLIGTSNTTACTVTGLPTIITPTRQQFVLALQRDNTTTDFIGELRVENTGVLTLCRQVGSAGGFTAANNKGLLGTTISYTID